VTAQATQSTKAPKSRIYNVTYRLKPLPAAGVIRVSIELSGELKSIPSLITLTVDPERHQNFEGDGKVDVTHEKRPGKTDPTDVVKWAPPAKGGSLSYDFKVNRLRSVDRYDARMTSEWAIFRADHVVPSLTSRALKSATSKASILLDLPSKWVGYSAYGAGTEHRIKIDDPERSFDRPKGWMILGKIGSRADVVAGTEVRVAAPKGTNVRRQDTLAMISTNLPNLGKIFDGLPSHLLVILAPDPFWRGGLSGPNSLFLHADRPLISENRTSTLLHELVHVVSGIHGDKLGDWIAEGTAEYYSIELLRRSHNISDNRFEETVKKLAAWGSDAKSLAVSHSSGATTARAVTVFVRLDREIRERTDNKKSLDDVVRALSKSEQRANVGLELLTKVTAKIIGGTPATLEPSSLGY
jgi:hypothetical protein